MTEGWDSSGFRRGAWEGRIPAEPPELPVPQLGRDTAPYRPPTPSLLLEHPGHKSQRASPLDLGSEFSLLALSSGSNLGLEPDTDTSCGLDRAVIFKHLIESWNRITESLRLEKTSEIIKSNRHPNTPHLLNHVPKCHIYVVFEPLQGWGLHHCPGQPGLTPDHSFREEIFPNIQSEPPLMQLEAISLP